MKIYSAVVFAIIAMMFAEADAALADPAASPLTLCNQMPDHIRVAVGYFSSGVNDTKNVLTGPFVSRGWWPIQPGECQTFDNPFGARYMFWFAFSIGFNDSQAAIADARASSDFHFCVTDYFQAAAHLFTYEDENVAAASCDQAGTNLWVTPRRVDTFIQSRVDVTSQ